MPSSDTLVSDQWRIVLPEDLGEPVSRLIESRAQHMERHGQVLWEASVEQPYLLVVLRPEFSEVDSRWIDVHGRSVGIFRTSTCF